MLTFGLMKEEEIFDLDLIKKMKVELPAHIQKIKKKLQEQGRKAATFVSHKLKEMHSFIIKQQQNQQDYIGLDKVTVSNLGVRMLDLHKLQHNNNNVRIYERDVNNSHAVISKPTIDNHSFTYSSIKIEDNNLFKSLSLGATITEDGVRDFSHLVCFVEREGEGNYRPYTIQEFQEHMNHLQSYIQETYGIYVDFINATFKELELNQNIHLERDFHSYQHLINYLAQFASKKYSKSFYKSNKGRFTGISLKNKSFELKIYDKKEQLKKKKVQVKDETMRVEISVLNKSKNATKNIKKYLLTDKIFEVTQATLNAFFSSMLASILFNQLYKEKLKQEKRIKRLAKRFADTKAFITQLYAEESQEKTIALFSKEQLKDTVHYEQISLLSDAQQTAEQDLTFITKCLKIA